MFFLLMDAFPCSRIFWIAALRFGLCGTGGGGTPAGLSSARRARWVAFKSVSSECSGGLLSDGAEIALEVGSR